MLGRENETAITARRPLFTDLKEHMRNGFYGKDILSVRQFDREKLEYLFGVAEEMRHMVQQIGSTDLLRGRVLANLFYEPSTRTSSSFMAAMQRLGGNVIPINEVHYSSVTKGESLPDTIRSLECYADIIVLRHPEVGSAQVAADFSAKPIINAGDGAGEHPTQALLDLYTIQKELGGIDGQCIAVVGDLKYGRTVHSLVRLLKLFNVRVVGVSPEELFLPLELVREWQEERRFVIPSCPKVEDVLEVADVLYVTRVQRERFEDQELYEKVKNCYVITPELLKGAKEHMVVMHPLPRVGEISYDVDGDPRVAYFRQMENGMFIRMALLAAILGRA